MNADVMVLRSGVAPARGSATRACTPRFAWRTTDAPGYGFDFPCPDAGHGVDTRSEAACRGGGYRPQRRASLSAALAVSSGLALGIGSLATSLLLLAG